MARSALAGLLVVTVSVALFFNGHLWWTSVKERKNKEAIGGCKIFVRRPTLNSTCMLNNTTWKLGQPGRGVEGYHSLPHERCSYSFSHHFVNALMNSDYFTHDPDMANLHLLDLHCHVMAWYSAELTRSGSEAERQLHAVVNHFVQPGDRNMVLIIQHPSLVRFFDACKPSFDALTVISERNQRCPDDSQELKLSHRSIIIPYFIWPDTNLLRLSAEGHGRFYDLFFVGGTANASHMPSGTRMRHALVTELSALEDDKIFVRAACGHCQNSIGFDSMLRLMLNSTFCLIPPGDQQSSRRIPEAMLTGCIPVFVFPPIHALPLSHLVNYSLFSVFIRLERPFWLTPDSFEDMHYKPDASFSPVYSAANIADIINIVRTANATALQYQLLAQRHVFISQGRFTNPANPRNLEDAVLQKLCRMARPRW